MVKPDRMGAIMQATIERELLRRVRRIDNNLLQVREQTAHRMPQLWAAIVGLLVCAVGTHTLESRHIPFVSEYYELTTDYIANHAATAGVAVGDWLGDIDRGLPTETIANVPNGSVKTSILGLDELQTCRLMMAMRDRESTHNYQITNWAYYLGGYQFGASALAVVGLIHQSAVDKAPRRVRQGLPPDHKQFLLNTANWRQGSASAFLNNPALQDRAFIVLATANVKAGFASRALIKTKPERIAGYVAAAHLKGSGAANSWYLRGKDSHDGNDTNTSSYARLGENAINKRSQYCQEKTPETTSWSLWK